MKKSAEMVNTSTILHPPALYRQMNKEENITYELPNLGCMVGVAYQKMVGSLGEALAKAGLKISVPEYLVLRVLYGHDGCQQCDIAAALGKDKAAICRCVSGMVRKGLLTTKQVSHKCLRVHLTEEARGIEAAVMRVGAERDALLRTIVPAEDLETFRRVLAKIIEEP